MLRLLIFLTSLSLLWASPARAEDKPAPGKEKKAPATPDKGKKAPPPPGDKDKAKKPSPPPLRSVRVPHKQEKNDRSRQGSITVSVGTSPGGASVTYGGKLLGATPFSFSAKQGSTPLDVVIRKKGYMTLRTRIRRKVSRTYYFRLHPAKFR